MTVAFEPGQAYGPPLPTLAEVSRIFRDAIRDKSYADTPLGLEVARYIRWKRNEWGATPETIRDYESILARLALFYADRQLSDFETPDGADLLREAWDFYWGEKTARTRSKTLSVYRDFFDWAVRERRGIHGNPARMLRSPKRRGVKREPFGREFVTKVISSQEYVADRLGTILILEYALRRAEVARVNLRDFDFERRVIVVTGKGGVVRAVPIVDESFWRDLDALALEIGWDSSLLYRTTTRGMVTFRYHNRQLVPRSVNSWWYRCLARAGYVDNDKDGGTWRGFNMHRGRHTVATDILRSTGNLVAAQKVLGHKDSATTEQFYSTYDTEDVAEVLRGMRGQRGYE